MVSFLLSVLQRNYLNLNEMRGGLRDTGAGGCSKAVQMKGGDGAERGEAVAHEAASTKKHFLRPSSAKSLHLYNDSVCYHQRLPCFSVK